MHVALHVNHFLLNDCHCAGRPFQRVPLLIISTYIADSIQKSLVRGWLTMPELLLVLIFALLGIQSKVTRAGVKNSDHQKA